jgi:hypothetical protein
MIFDVYCSFLKFGNSRQVDVMLLSGTEWTHICVLLEFDAIP